MKNRNGDCVCYGLLMNSSGIIGVSRVNVSVVCSCVGFISIDKCLLKVWLFI